MHNLIVLKTNLNLFLILSNCASVGERKFGNYQDALYVREKKILLNILICCASLNFVFGPNNITYGEFKEG